MYCLDSVSGESHEQRSGQRANRRSERQSQGRRRQDGRQRNPGTKRQGSKSRRQGPGGLRRSRGCREERHLSWMNSGFYCSEEGLNGKKLNMVAVASASFVDVVSI